MKKINRTYVMGAVFLIFAIWVLWQTSMIPEKLVSNEPGPKLFPYISAMGMITMALLSMIFDGRKEAEENKKGVLPYLNVAGWKRMFLIMSECVLFCISMDWIGFWITSMVGMMMFILTLRAGKKIHFTFAVILSVALGSICYFGFTRGFHIPLPKGILWDYLGIKML